MATSEESPEDPVAAFIAAQRLSENFREVVEQCYLPLAEWLGREAGQQCPLIVGIGGAQGTGKSTFAAFLELSLGNGAGFSVAQMSLDDFYLTHAERHRLGMSVHPLLATRGVPGTHDLQMLSACLDQLALLRPGETLAVPRFDKSQDDRADPASWPIVRGPVDIILLEGWCIGMQPQKAEALAAPINALERVADAGGIWRRYVNEQLAGGYADLFSRLHRLIWLQAPGFETVRRWRTDQEHRLAEHMPARGRSMSDNEVTRFVRHFERLTRATFEKPPAQADVVLVLDDGHSCSRLDWRQIS